MGFLSGIFGKKESKPTIRYEDICDKPLVELLPFMQEVLTKNPSGSASVLVFFQRRLFEIAYWDFHVSDGDRAKAFELAQSFTASIESAFAGKPDVLEGYRYTVKKLIHTSPYGTLFWLIEENNIPSDQIPIFAIRPENARLLRKYLEEALASGPTVTPKVIKEFSRDLVREVIHARRPVHTKNAVLILHGLVVGRDGTLEAILKPEEITAFRNAHKDYAKAQEALQTLGIQPDDSGGLSFEPTPSPDSLADLVIMDMMEVHKGIDEDAELKAYLDGLSEEDKSNVRFTKSLMTLHLAIQQAGSVYGEAFGTSLRTSILEKLPVVRDRGLELSLKRFELAEDMTYAEVGFSPDFIILNQFLYIGKETEQTEELFEMEKESTIRGANILSSYRTRFLEYFRYRLRVFAARERGEPTERHPKDYADDWLYKPSTSC